MIGTVLNSLNIRPDAKTLAIVLNHGEAKVLVNDREFSATIKQAIDIIDWKILVIDIDDELADGGERLGETDYETFLQGADTGDAPNGVSDEWQALSLLYKSGTTGNPKGCVDHHRGAYLNAPGSMSTMGLTSESRYSWTLPKFHCDGWTFTWAVTWAMGTHVCLRKVGTGLTTDESSPDVSGITRLSGACLCPEASICSPFTCILIHIQSTANESIWYAPHRPTRAKSASVFQSRRQLWRYVSFTQ